MAVPKARKAVSKQRIMACNYTIRNPQIKKRSKEGLNRLGLLRNHNIISCIMMILLFPLYSP